PFMAQGHMIPMIDIARLLAERGVIITIITTPVNAARFEPVIARSVQSGLRIRLVQLQFPGVDSGLIPAGQENIDLLQPVGLLLNFFKATNLFQEPVERLFEELSPPPSCIVSDFCLPYTNKIAGKFQIPRISFHGTSCFYLLCMHNIMADGFLSKIVETVTSDSEYFTVPNMPDEIKFTRAQIPIPTDEIWKESREEILEADKESYGVIMNTFEKIEAEYVREYRELKRKKVWSIGPLSLCNKSGLDKAQRGKKAAVDEHQCLSWLDSQQPSSVIYACLGSINNAPPAQLIELGIALEESNKPFIWVLREWNSLNGVRQWISDYGFQERIKGRGFLIKGWAPQVLILSHPAIGGFLTHCGWNSTIEGISAGVPLITWPLFGDQFCNEKLVVEILKIGVSVGVEKPFRWEEEHVSVLAKKEDIKNAIDKVMEEDEEGERRRQRAKELAEMAKKAVEEGGSSHRNLTMLIDDLKQQSSN
ncbi:UDP-glycosyltransferase 73C1-like, partial [Carica papaya]|uniref:UDP-glycosyltransferase 73C1-like n=1 Tax=Carica papaya TaxID=3649 RepID=UPI000B8D0CA9